LTRSARQLAGALTEVADVDWRHPAWWALVGGGAVLDQLPARADAGELYLASDGGPWADTFMASPATPPASLREAADRGVALVRAAHRALSQLDGALPGQPLLCHLARTAGQIDRVPHPAGDRFVAATATGRYVAVLPRDPARDHDLAEQLVAAATGRPAPGLVPLRDRDRPRDAAVALSLVREQPGTARHLHRRAWTGRGGPWLGIGWTEDLSLVSTSHMVVDGYGHALLADRILAADRAAPSVDRRPLPDRPAVPGARPLGVATGELDGDLDFAWFLHATGRAIDRFTGTGAADRSRTVSFQIPIAPGSPDDPMRRRRRVVPGLMSLHIDADGTIESPDQLRARLPALLAREAAMRGPLTLLQRGVLALPLPVALTRRLMSSSRGPRPWLPPVELLAGRGCASFLRFAAGDRPQRSLYAVSAPALDPTASDPTGGTVLTAVERPGGYALAVSGTGRAGTSAGAAEFLELWRQMLQNAHAFSDSPPLTNPSY
jgi:hypothetical protein